jgi:hypothetical protein
MSEIVILPVLVAAVVSLMLSGTYYSVLGDRLARVGSVTASGARPAGWIIVAELMRSLVIAIVTSGLASRTGAGDWPGGLMLGLALWIGFPVVLWTGAMLHERTPWRLAAIHAGDWLIKLTVIGVIVAVWR